MAGEKTRPARYARGVRQDGLRLTHAPRPLGRPLGERADLRADEADPAGAQPLEVRASLRVGVHLVVHRGGQKYWGGGGEKQRGEEIVREALRHPGDEVSRRRGHEHEVRPLPEPDMGERPAGLPQRAEDGAPRERLECERPHELGGALREDDVHPRARFGEPAGERATLIAGVPTRHAEDDAAAGPHAHASERRRRTSL